LKKQFPANTEILEGKEKYGPEDHADTPEKKNAVLAGGTFLSRVIQLKFNNHAQRTYKL
jgi:hypothetical protein